MEQLRRFLTTTHRIADADALQICSNFEILSLKKDEHLLKEGVQASAYWFIASGALRVYFLHNEVEATAWIAFENDFFTDLSSVRKKIPSRFNIQAMEDTTLYVIDAKTMEHLYQRYPDWQRLGRQLWESAFLNVIDAVVSFQTSTAEERYLAAMQIPNLMQRVPLKYLSSYLGITPTSLSRLRKKIK